MTEVEKQPEQLAHNKPLIESDKQLDGTVKRLR